MTDEYKDNSLDDSNDQLDRFYMANFKRELGGLLANSKSIASLTKAASAGSKYADEIIRMIMDDKSTDDLAKLYRMDSIMKNVGSPYLELILTVLAESFTKTFKLADEKTRDKLFVLRCSWKGYVPSAKLVSIDTFVNKIDDLWPIDDKSATSNKENIDPTSSVDEDTIEIDDEGERKSGRKRKPNAKPCSGTIANKAKIQSETRKKQCVLAGTAEEEIVDRRVGNCVGIKRLKAFGYKSIPEIIPTHVYITNTQFIELRKMIHDMVEAETLNPGTVKKWVKFVECHWEYDWYQRKAIHRDPYSTSCSVCHNFVDKMEERSNWWLKIGDKKCIRLTFKKSVGDRTFHCSVFTIRTYGVLEVELVVESESKSEHIRRNF